MATCDLATCLRSCLREGYVGGRCAGASCECLEGPSNGDAEDLDATGGPEEAGETEPEAADDSSGGDEVSFDPDTGDETMADDAWVGDDVTDIADIGDETMADDAWVGDDVTDIPDTVQDTIAHDDAPDFGDVWQDGAVCPPGLTFCGDGCYDTSTDPARCGSCTRACRSDQRCIGGTCLCAPGYVECAARCTDLSSDPTNCGACGNACGTGKVCVSSSCVCAGGRTDCFGVCVDTSTDPNHCGRCGNQCPGGGSCSGGVCTATTAEFTFPSFGDIYYGFPGDNPYLWYAGSYLEGTRSTLLPSATQVAFTLYTNLNDPNRLYCDSLDLAVLINGVVVGNFQFPAHTASVSHTFNFGPIAGPTYTIRLLVTRTVPWPCGVLAITPDCPWTLRQ